MYNLEIPSIMNSQFTNLHCNKDFHSGEREAICRPSTDGWAWSLEMWGSSLSLINGMSEAVPCYQLIFYLKKIKMQAYWGKMFKKFLEIITVK